MINKAVLLSKPVVAAVAPFKAQDLLFYLWIAVTLNFCQLSIIFIKYFVHLDKNWSKLIDFDGN
jgi:hypothetical protein